MKPAELELATLKALAAEASLGAGMAWEMCTDAGLGAGDFITPEYAALFEAFAVRLRENRPLDAVALAHSLVGRVKRETVADVVTAGDFGVLRERAATMRRRAKRRAVLAALKSAAKMAENEGHDPDEAGEEAIRALEQLRRKDDGMQPASSALVAFTDRLEQVQSGQREPVLETGIHPLDSVIGGLNPTLTIIGALPGVGKSALLASIVRNLSRRGVPSGVFSLEDEGEWLIRRLSSEAANVPLFVLGRKRMTPNQLNRVMDAAVQIGNDLGKVWIDERKGLTAADIVASARSAITKRGVKAIFVDHLGEIRLNRSDRHDLDITAALQELRALATAYRVPVVVLCHVRRREGLSKKDEPTLTDFAFSSGVERMARVALALSRPEGVPNPDDPKAGQFNTIDDGGQLVQRTLRVTVLKQTEGEADACIDLPFRGPAGLVGNGERLRPAEEHYSRLESEMATWGDE